MKIRFISLAFLHVGLLFALFLSSGPSCSDSEDEAVSPGSAVKREALGESGERPSALSLPPSMPSSSPTLDRLSPALRSSVERHLTPSSTTKNFTIPGEARYGWLAGSPATGIWFPGESFWTSVLMFSGTVSVALTLDDATAIGILDDPLLIPAVVVFVTASVVLIYYYHSDAPAKLSALLSRVGDTTARNVRAIGSNIAESVEAQSQRLIEQMMQASNALMTTVYVQDIAGDASNYIPGIRGAWCAVMCPGDSMRIRMGTGTNILQACYNARQSSSTPNSLFCSVIARGML